MTIKFFSSRVTNCEKYRCTESDADSRRMKAGATSLYKVPSQSDRSQITT